MGVISDAIDSLQEWCENLFKDGIKSQFDSISDLLTETFNKTTEDGGLISSFAQRIFKGDTELVELVRELGGVDFALSVIVHRINHLYLSFRFYCCKTNRPNFTK